MKTKKSKILYLTFHPDIGGGEAILLSLLTKLYKNIFEPTVVVTKKGQLSKALSKIKIKTYILNLSPYFIRELFIPGMSPIGIYKFTKLAKKIKPDLIHVNHLNLAVYAKAAAIPLKIPVVATAHGNWDCIYFYQDLVNRFCTDKIFANTPETAKSLLRQKIIQKNKVTIIPFGIDTNLFKPATRHQVPGTRHQLGLPQNDLIVTIVGRLDPVKDHLTFLKAAKLINEKLNNVTFFIVGSKLGDFSNQSGTYAKQVQDYLSKNPALEKKVVFGSFINSMSSVYHATDILVSSSPKESFGLALAEGAACGLPLIATSDQKLIVKNGQKNFNLSRKFKTSQ